MSEKVTKVPRLPARDREGHKGSYGKVLVVGGSRGMAGAVGLASNSALRGGAGLVMFAAPEKVQLTIAAIAPCATSTPLPCDEIGNVSAEAGKPMRQTLDKCDILAIGPGFDKGTPQEQLIRIALEQDKPAVIDADGLNNLAKIDNWPALRKCPLVLTPHPGEFSRLTGKGIKDIQSDRRNAAEQAAGEWAAATETDQPLVLVLKGAGTVVTDGERTYINDTGNPGMASGGSGDVLTGLTAALLGQGLEAFDAACLAVWVHGTAGDLAAGQLGQPSVMATDLLDYLPEAMTRAIEQE